MTDEQPDGFFPNLDAMDADELCEFGASLAALQGAVSALARARAFRVHGNISDAMYWEARADELLKSAPPWAKW